MSYWTPWLSPCTEDQHRISSGLKGKGRSFRGRLGLHIQGPQTQRPKHQRNTRHSETQLCSCYSPSETPYITGTSSGSSPPTSLQSLGSQGLWASIDGPSLRYDSGPVCRPQTGALLVEIFAWNLLLLSHAKSHEPDSRFLGFDFHDVTSFSTYRPEEAALIIWIT